MLKALTQATTGAIAAAATTSLPEAPGGPRNWDYRASWVRDSVFALRSLAELGYTAEADGFRRFVQRSAAGSAQELQIMYGLGGERRLVELTLDDLEGYGGARPVRVGNAASNQARAEISGKPVQLLLGEAPLAADAVEHLELGRVGGRRPEHPGAEVERLLRVAADHQRVEGEGGELGAA